MFAIFVYIVVIQVIQKTGYLSFLEPIGNVRLSVQPPTIDRCDPDDPGCKFDYKPTTELPYCAGYTGLNASFTSKDCMYMGALEVNFPVTSGSPFYLSTRIRESNQTLTCRDPSTTNHDVCQQTYEYACYDSFDIDPNGCVATKANTANCWGNDKKKGNHCWAQRTYFVPQIEEFTLLLDHAVRTNNGVSAAGSEMSGQLKYCNGSEVVPNFTPNGLGYYVRMLLGQGRVLACLTQSLTPLVLFLLLFSSSSSSSVALF